MSTKYQYVGEPTLTRGDFGQNIETITKLSWGVQCDCLSDDCNCQPSWQEDETGGTWGVWDSDFGWIAPLNLNLSDIGQAIN